MFAFLPVRCTVVWAKAISASAQISAEAGWTIGSQVGCSRPGKIGGQGAQRWGACSVIGHMNVGRHGSF